MLAQLRLGRSWQIRNGICVLVKDKRENCIFPFLLRFGRAQISKEITAQRHINWENVIWRTRCIFHIVCCWLLTAKSICFYYFLSTVDECIITSATPCAEIHTLLHQSLLSHATCIHRSGSRRWSIGLSCKHDKWIFFAPCYVQACANHVRVFALVCAPRCGQEM